MNKGTPHPERQGAGMPTAEDAFSWFSLWPRRLTLAAPGIASILLKGPPNCISKLMELRTTEDEASWTRGDCSSGPFDPW